MSDSNSSGPSRYADLAKAVRIWRHRQPDGSVRYTVYDEISEKPYVPDAFSNDAVEEMIAAGAPVEDR
jgi:hypothetical protein